MLIGRGLDRRRRPALLPPFKLFRGVPLLPPLRGEPFPVIIQELRASAAKSASVGGEAVRAGSVRAHAAPSSDSLLLSISSGYPTQDTMYSSFPPNYRSSVNCVSQRVLGVHTAAGSRSWLRIASTSSEEPWWSDMQRNITLDLVTYIRRARGHLDAQRVAEPRRSRSASARP